MNIDTAMEFINSFSKSGKPVTDLSRARELMALVGDPQDRLRFVHVAGTNGKGSVVEYISNALMNAGYKVGQFTSPYVTRYNDRIRINGRDIDDDALCRVTETVKNSISCRDYSQFEITMASAMCWYAEERCDVVVLEAGIGGLLDCTNVIKPPLLSVITSVSLDHTAILGDTVDKIARQKAGIIKAGSAVVLSADQSSPEVYDIVRETAERVGAEFVDPVKTRFTGTNGIFAEFEYNGEKYTPAMPGIHQHTNAVTAITACEYLRGKGFDITDEAIKKAVETAAVKARVQVIEGEPRVIVDGAHNPEGVSALADDILMKLTADGTEIYAVLGMVNSKDFTESTDILAPYCTRIYTVDDFAPNAVPAEELAEIAADYTEAEACGSLKKAVKSARKAAKNAGGIMAVCGSLYLASKYLNDFT